ncbi:MAG TPA: TVP38/TMEM64 family protein [Dissulfurispiraceae bacterium]|nr:TVP38/TMEM64 family protein [Dissulfurispiraceae bacterium]
MNRSHMQKIFLLILLATAVIVVKAYNLEHYLTLEYVKASQSRFAALYAETPVPVIAVYMCIYIAVVSLSIPGAVPMTLAGGALFSFLSGTIVVSFASTIGATLACTVSRFLLRDWIQKKFEDNLSTLNDGIRREGAFYLLSMRLNPLFPFSAINLGMGLTKMPLRTFYLVSQIGMLPGTMVYVNAGRELAKIESLGDIASPSLVLSFVLLSIFPIIIRKTLDYLQKHREHGGSSNGKV